jgi:hypothetical protein
MDFVGGISFDKIRIVTIAPEELLQFLVADPRCHGGIGDLIAIQV